MNNKEVLKVIFLWNSAIADDLDTCLPSTSSDFIFTVVWMGEGNGEAPKAHGRGRGESRQCKRRAVGCPPSLQFLVTPLIGGLFNSATGVESIQCAFVAVSSALPSFVVVNVTCKTVCGLSRL